MSQGSSELGTVNGVAPVGEDLLAWLGAGLPGQCLSTLVLAVKKAPEDPSVPRARSGLALPSLTALGRGPEPAHVECRLYASPRGPPCPQGSGLPSRSSRDTLLMPYAFPQRAAGNRDRAGMLAQPPGGWREEGPSPPRSEPSSVTQPCAVQSRSPQAWGRATVGSSPIVRTCSQHLPPQALHTHREILPPKVGASSEDPPFTNWGLFPSPCREHPHLTNTCLVSVNPDTCSA